MNEITFDTGIQKLLLVEENADYREQVRQIFEGEYSIAETNDAQEAISKLLELGADPKRTAMPIIDRVTELYMAIRFLLFTSKACALSSSDVCSFPVCSGAAES